MEFRRVLFRSELGHLHGGYGWQEPVSTRRYLADRRLRGLCSSLFAGDGVGSGTGAGRSEPLVADVVGGAVDRIRRGEHQLSEVRCGLDGTVQDGGLGAEEVG